MPRSEYVLKDGTKPTGVTTILGTIGYGKQALISWSNRIGREGLDQKTELNRMADIGSCAHEQMDYLLSGKWSTTREWPADIQAAAELPVKSFNEWRAGKRIKLVASELKLVSEVFRCGGTADGIIRIDGGPLVMTDYKTSAAIYETHIAQVAAYAAMVEHQYGKAIDSALILRFGKDGSAEELEVSGQMMADGLELFQIALRLYQMESQMKKHIRAKRPLGTQPAKIQLPSAEKAAS